jgi:alpha-D-ribose 1-methylphosphonate 5-triphosphate synthase subunit PhnH
MSEAITANPSHDRAHNFRSILDAASHPGRIYAFVPHAPLGSGLSPEAATVALTLCDFLTPVWLCENFSTPATEHYLRFHIGAPLTRKANEAAFAFCDVASGVPDLAQFSKGTHELPDLSATIVLQVPQMLSDVGVRLKGPGIKNEHQFAAAALGGDFWRQMQVARRDFPLGIDVILVGPGAIAAIPRSTQILLLENA